MEKVNRELEHALIARDKLIAELRLRMPATADRDEIILKATATATTAAQQERAGTARNYESEQSMRIAQSTISSLQVNFTTQHLYISELTQSKIRDLD